MHISGITGAGGHFSHHDAGKQQLIDQMNALINQFTQGDYTNPHADFDSFLDKYNALCSSLDKYKLSDKQVKLESEFQLYFGVMVTGGEGQFAMHQANYHNGYAPEVAAFDKASAALKELINSL